MGPVSKFALLSFAVLVAANSKPELTTCDAYDPTLGYIVKGNQTGRQMWWAAAAVRTDAYTIRSGDSCGSDPTSYVPGQFMSIHVRTHNYKGQFRGFLLYATSASGQRVGDWELPWPNSNMFWKPTNPPCQNKTLMHLNGAEKYYHHEFLFKAPPAGTGTIEFHTLIKRGQANLGEFYWANLNGNLQLTEGAAPGGNKWVEGNVGTTCDFTCTQAGSTCDTILHNNAFQYGSLLQRDVVFTTGCNNPALESNNQVIYKDQFGWCYYPSVLAGVATGACGMPAPNGSKPICSCGSAGQPSSRIFAPRDTACLNGYVAMGSASRASSSLVSIALMLFASMWFSRTSSSGLFLALVLGCAHVAHAHNWVIDVSRSYNQASTYKPCRPRVNDSPHWQINEGQTYNMEWATGHDWYFYYTVVNSKDLEKLNDISEDNLDEYIDGCLPSQDYMRGKAGAIDPWRKQHISQNPADITVTELTSGLPIYDRNISFGDPLYIVRPPQFNTIRNEVRWVYTNVNTDLDRRCEYYNAKYPFIIAVHRFVQVQTMVSRAGERDMAQFTINLTAHRPYGYGQGSYVMQYLWRGYFDCADVDVFDPSTPVSAIGGRPLLPSEPQWNKVDHCQFEEIQGVETSCMEVVTDANTVLSACLSNTNCQGVNVVPLWLPGTVYPLFSNRVGIEWDGMGCRQNLFASLGQNTMVGYGLQARLPNNTHSSYSVTDDPEDPLFYATCFIKKPQWKFDLVVAADPNVTVIYVPPPWAFSDRCVDCATWKQAQDTDIVPVWKLPQRCRNCELEPPPPTQMTTLDVVSRGQKCDGSWNGATYWFYGAPNPTCATVRCVKTLYLVGVPSNGGITAEQCVAKAKLDPECSEHVQHNSHQGTSCECWIKTNPGCCGICKPVDYLFPNWKYNVYSIAPPASDPNCSMGTRSADNAYCCPSTCSFCPSKPIFKVSFQSRVYQAPIGWGVDNGEVYGNRNNTYSQAYNTYGWNCDRSDQAEDRDQTSEQAKNYNGTNYHSTVIKTDVTLSCQGTATWDVLIGANGTNTTLEVHTLYSKPFASHQGCKLNGVPNYDPYHSRLGTSDMAWVVRTVSTTTGKITWSGAASTNCAAIAAMKIYTSTQTTATDCQFQNGMCCPDFLDMASRPCSTHLPPCSL